MCLAVPGRIVAAAADEATVDMQGNRLRVSTLLTPEARIGDWVLVHAGFAISTLSEQDALETWEYLREISALEPAENRGEPDEAPLRLRES